MTMATLTDLARIIERTLEQGGEREMGASALLTFAIWPDGSMNYGGFASCTVVKLAMIELLRLHADRLEGEVHAEINAQDAAKIRALQEASARHQAGARPN